MGHDDRTDGWHDELTAWAAALAPARDTPKLTPDELTSLAKSAMREPTLRAAKAPAPSAWSRRRLGYATAGALVASGALVVAGILGIEAAAPTLPALASPVIKIKQGPIPAGVALSDYDYAFSTSPNLPSAAGTATAYALVSPTDVAATTGAIATALGLSGGVTYLGPDNYNGGPSPGPDVTIDVESGVLHWLYPTWSGNVKTTPSLGNPSTCCTIPVNPDAPLPTDVKATTDAQQLLRSMGVDETQLGTPQVSRYPAAVHVVFPVVIDGVTTDQQDGVSYGPGATVLGTSGIIATATPSATYPTIAPTDAVGLLPTNSLVPSNTGAWLAPPSTGWVKSAGPTGPSGATGPSGLPVVTVNINQAMLRLGTYVLSSGESWLLPTWALSGPASGSVVNGGSSYSVDGSTYSAHPLAVPATYVQVAPEPNQ